jgi:hypothetical protein
MAWRSTTLTSLTSSSARAELRVAVTTVAFNVDGCARDGKGDAVASASAQLANRRENTIFFMESTGKQKPGPGFPAGQWASRPRIPFKKRKARPPRWPVSGLAGLLPSPSQVLFEDSAQWHCLMEAGGP